MRCLRFMLSAVLLFFSTTALAQEHSAMGKSPTPKSKGERKKFLAGEWPRITATIQRLRLRTEELLERANGQASPGTPSSKAPQSKSKAPHGGEKER